MAVTLQLGVWQTVRLGPHRTLVVFPADTITGPHWLSVKGEDEALLELTADDRSPPDRPYEVRVRRGMGEPLSLPAQVRVRRGECCLSTPSEATVEVRVTGAPTNDLETPTEPRSFPAAELVGAEASWGEVARRIQTAPTFPPDFEIAPSQESAIPELALAVTSAVRPAEPAPSVRRSLPEDEPTPEFDLMPEPPPAPVPVPAPVAETPKKGFFGKRRS